MILTMELPEATQTIVRKDFAGNFKLVRVKAKVMKKMELVVRVKMDPTISLACTTSQMMMNIIRTTSQIKIVTAYSDALDTSDACKHKMMAHLATNTTHLATMTTSTQLTMMTMTAQLATETTTTLLATETTTTLLAIVVAPPLPKHPVTTSIWIKIALTMTLTLAITNKRMKMKMRMNKREQLSYFMTKMRTTSHPTVENSSQSPSLTRSLAKVDSQLASQNPWNLLKLTRPRSKANAHQKGFLKAKKNHSCN